MLKSSIENTIITSRTGARQFESFLKSITKCDSLLDARRLRNDIVAEIRRTREIIGEFFLFLLSNSREITLD